MPTWPGWRDAPPGSTPSARQARGGPPARSGLGNARQVPDVVAHHLAVVGVQAGATRMGPAPGERLDVDVQAHCFELGR